VIKTDPRYQDMVSTQQSGSLPSELYGDYMDSVEEGYYKDKKTLKEILREIGFSVTPRTTYEELYGALVIHPKLPIISDKNLSFLIQDVIQKAEKDEKKKEKDAEKKKKKYTSRFFDLLDSSKELTKASTWPQVREALATHSAFQKVPFEEERERLFNDFMTKKKDESSDEEGRIRSDSPDGKKKHKKRSSSSSKPHKKHRHHQKRSGSLSRSRSRSGSHSRSGSPSRSPSETRDKDEISKKRKETEDKSDDERASKSKKKKTTGGASSSSEEEGERKD